MERSRERGKKDLARRGRQRAEIARIDPSGEFGFIATGDGREVYFHKNSVLNGGFARLKPGSSVSFAEEDGEKGAQASTVKPTSRRPPVRQE